MHAAAFLSDERTELNSSFINFLQFKNKYISVTVFKIFSIRLTVKDNVGSDFTSINDLFLCLYHACQKSQFIYASIP